MRAIVFDFDGVIATASRSTIAPFTTCGRSRRDLSEKDYCRPLSRYDDVGRVQDDGGRPRPPWDIEGLPRGRPESGAHRSARTGMSMLFPGAGEAVQRAAAAVPIAIASGALGAEIRKVLERERLAKYFTAIVAAEDTLVSKPAPDPYLRAVALLAPALGGAVAAADVIAVEDSPWGLQSARAAGLRTVAVAHTYAASALDADLVIGWIGELDIDRLKRL